MDDGILHFVQNDRGGVLLDCFVATAPRNDGREGYCAVRLRAMTGERRVGGGVMEPTVICF